MDTPSERHLPPEDPPTFFHLLRASLSGPFEVSPRSVALPRGYRGRQFFVFYDRPQLPPLPGTTLLHLAFNNPGVRFAYLLTLSPRRTTPSCRHAGEPRQECLLGAGDLRFWFSGFLVLAFARPRWELIYHGRRSGEFLSGIGFPPPLFFPPSRTNFGTPGGAYSSFLPLCRPLFPS